MKMQNTTMCKILLKTQFKKFLASSEWIWKERKIPYWPDFSSHEARIQINPNLRQRSVKVIAIISIKAESDR